MAVIPRKGEIARADEFAGFSHDAILPSRTDISRSNHSKKGENSEEDHHSPSDSPHQDKSTR